MVKNPPANAGDVRDRVLIEGRSKEIATCSRILVGNSMDRGAWWATVHGVTKSQTWLRQHSTVQGYKCRYLSFAQQLRVKRMFSG